MVAIKNELLFGKNAILIMIIYDAPTNEQYEKYALLLRHFILYICCTTYTG